MPVSSVRLRPARLITFVRNVEKLNERMPVNMGYVSGPHKAVKVGSTPTIGTCQECCWLHLKSHKLDDARSIRALTTWVPNGTRYRSLV